MRKSVRGLVLLGVGLLGLTACGQRAPDPGLQARCGEYWGVLKKGQPEETLVCSSEGDGQPWIYARTESGRVYAGMNMLIEGGAVRYVYVRNGRVVGWDAW